MRRHNDSHSTLAAETTDGEMNLPALDDSYMSTLQASTAETFWNKQLTSGIAQRLKDTRCTTDHIQSRIQREKLDKANPLSSATDKGTGIHSSSDVFPDWMIQSSEFEEVDKVIKLNRLDNALRRLPHVRNADELKTVSDFLIKSWPTAADLGEERVGEMARRVTVREFEKGQYILTQNQESQRFYILVRGKVDIHRLESMKHDGKPRDGIVVTLGPGASFGEAAVKNGTLCNASCIANTDSVSLLVLSKTDHDHIMAEVLEAENQDAFDVLKAIPMFKGWGRSRLDSVVRLVRRVRHPPGVDIMKQGDPPDNVYFISSGRIRIWKDIPVKTVNTWPTGPHSWKRVTRSVHKPFFLVEIGRGGFFGGKAIVEDSVRAATCTSATDVVLFSLDKTDFMNLLNMGHKSHAVDTVKHKAAYGYPDDNDILSLWTTLGGVKRTAPPPKLSKTADKLAGKLAKEKAEKAAKAAAKVAKESTENPNKENPPRLSQTLSARPQTAAVGGTFRPNHTFSGATSASPVQLSTRWAALRTSSQESLVDTHGSMLSGTLPMMSSSMHSRSQVFGGASTSSSGILSSSKKPAFARAFEQTTFSEQLSRPRSAHTPARLAYSNSRSDMRKLSGAFGELTGSGKFHF